MDFKFDDSNELPDLSAAALRSAVQKEEDLRKNVSLGEDPNRQVFASSSRGLTMVREEEEWSDASASSSSTPFCNTTTLPSRLPPKKRESPTNR